MTLSFIVFVCIAAVCAVCSLEASGGHSCKECMKVVHVICGKGDESEEGYGAKITCQNCIESGNSVFGVFFDN